MTTRRPPPLHTILAVLLAAEAAALAPACTGDGPSDQLEAEDPDLADPVDRRKPGHGHHRRDAGGGPGESCTPDAGAPDSGPPAVDAGPPDAGPPPVDAAPFACPFGPGEQGCVCGFKASVDPSEWEGYQLDCDAFGGFCRASCCPPGQRVDAADPTRCVPEPGTAPELRYFGPWPDHLDDISSMRLNWVAYGADTCRAEVRIDGGAPITVDGAGVDLLAIDELDDAIDEAALDATLTCENASGTTSAAYQIAAASDRVTATGVGGGFPQPVEICWAVLPFLATDVPPFAGGQCHVGVCPAGEEFDPLSSFPCFDPSFFQQVDDQVGCATSTANAVAGDLAYVSCENGDVQRAVHAAVIEP